MPQKTNNKISGLDINELKSTVFCIRQKIQKLSLHLKMAPRQLFSKITAKEQ
jgi:hypothetical protein